MLFGTLGTSLLGNLFTGKVAGKGIIRGHNKSRQDF